MTPVDRLRPTYLATTRYFPAIAKIQYIHRAPGDDDARPKTHLFDGMSVYAVDREGMRREDFGSHAKNPLGGQLFASMLYALPSCHIHTEDPATIPPHPPDYLAILSLGPDATDKEITRAWRRAVLAYHPDRLEPDVPPTSGRTKKDLLDNSVWPGETNGVEGKDIRLINEARWVLGDRERRKAWEEELKHSHKPTAVQSSSRTPHIYREISLEEFTPHFNTHTDDSVPIILSRAADQKDELAHDVDEPVYYTYPCRCSRLFRVSHEDLEAGVEVVGCEGCGEWIRVGYESIEVDEETNAL